MDIHFVDNVVKINCPSLSELIKTFYWYDLFIITGIYGLITHLKSLPAINRYNEELKLLKPNESMKSRDKRVDIYSLTPVKLFWIFICRSTIALPIRIVSVIIGITVAFISLPVTGKLGFANPVLQFGWKWHMSPEKVARIIRNIIHTAFSDEYYVY